MAEILASDTIVYEAIQRVFRNAIVAYIRERMTAAFGQDATSCLRKPFKEEEWEAITRSAQESAATGTIARKHQDDFDYLSVNHFFNLFDVYPKELFPAIEFSHGEKASKKLNSWLAEIKSIRDPVSHPPEQDLPIPDCLRVVDSAIRVVRLLELEDAMHRLEELYDNLRYRASSAPPPDIISPLYDTLPPKETVVVDFVGREHELAELWGWITDPDSFRWLLSGDGGKGKSAAAYRFAVAVRAQAPEELTGVFWMSAKRRRFESGTTVAISNPDFWDLESAIDRILRDYGASEFLNAPLAEKQQTAVNLLNDLPCLLIVDDLDSIQPEAEKVVEFLTFEVPRTKRSKVLITSRRQILGMGHSCTVIEGLSNEDANRFIDSRLHLMKLKQGTLGDRQRAQIIEVCEGSPLYIEDLLRLCRSVSVDFAISAWKQAGGDEARRYALEREMEMLSPLAREILWICSIANTPLSVVELARISGRREDQVLPAIDELQQMYLVPAPELIEQIPRFQVNRNLAALVLSALEGTERFTRLQNAVNAVLGQGFGPKLDQAVADHCRQARLLVDAARHEHAEATLRAGLKAFPNHPLLYSFLGWIYKRWTPRRTVDARAAFQRAYQLGFSESVMYWHWCKMEIDEDEWQKAVDATEKGLERCGREEWELLQLAGYVHSRLGQKLAFNTEKSLRHLHAADKYLRRAIDRTHAANADAAYISRAYRSFILNAKARGRNDHYCEGVQEWINWNPEDPVLDRELQFASEKCKHLVFEQRA